MRVPTVQSLNVKSQFVRVPTVYFFRTKNSGSFLLGNQFQIRLNSNLSVNVGTHTLKPSEFYDLNLSSIVFKKG
ncbi:hypothetical protein LEP1GSC186_0325 [Leptospira noguchii serovar Autumnalis str. ZUN142]|uniref:Uncharacterized protein n=1 Tax=Leptospira noguchii serovar Autumnalis str. ZUN142 TaxID=1085540 RepID=M6UCG7_9LEPT|nr:hypothetical protein LEP1GSC186_0325 [Leptospira noguchii serovar Autumnalis str. ZUN142]